MVTTALQQPLPEEVEPISDVLAAYRLAPRMATIEPSPFLAVMRSAKAVESRGTKVLYLSMGEPDFETPDHVKIAGIQAIMRGDTRYTAMDGTPALKEAICFKLQRDNALAYSASEVTVTLGGTQAIFNLMFATVGVGDEVILPAPFFQPYVSAVRLAGGIPILVQTREADGFVLKASDLEKVITPRTRWLILNSPSNPAGSVLQEEDLAAIADVVRRHPHLLVLSDDIYESILFTESRFKNIINVAPDLRQRTVILNGVSKAYAMTGWRIGYLAGPRPIIEAVSQVSATSTFTPCSITQAAAVEALASSQELVGAQAAVYRRRRDMMVQRLARIPEISLATPQGAFYLFPGCTGFYGRRTPEGLEIRNDVDFVLYVLETCGLALVQGSAFGVPGYFRISFAASDATLEQAMDKLELACANLR